MTKEGEPCAVVIAVYQSLSDDITAGGGTEAVSGSHGDDNGCCLSDEVILHLAKLGIKV